MRPMNPGELLESLAEDTWGRIRDGHALDVVQSEAALTDLMLLEIARARSPFLKVVKTPLDSEKNQGTDWEWWVGTQARGWARYAIQAKRLSLPSERYDKIAHKVDATPQIDILERYAAANGAVPLYCFYNFSDRADYTPYWHCHRPLDFVQLGCSITPLRTIRTAISQRGKRTFSAIHSAPFALPWRCLVRCPAFISTFHPDSSIRSRVAGTTHDFFGVPRVIHPSLPAGFGPALETGTLEFFDDDYFSSELHALPRRIAVIDLAESPDFPRVEGTEPP